MLAGCGAVIKSLINCLLLADESSVLSAPRREYAATCHKISLFNSYPVALRRNSRGIRGRVVKGINCGKWKEIEY